MTVTLHTGDAVQWARDYSGDPFYALLCDAPYHLTADARGVFRLDGIGANPKGKPRGGFMGKSWDGVDENGVGVAFDPETWRAFARVLYPGAFLFVFAGTINDDLISVAMREAGLRKYHKMMGWVYGSGFPKASRVNHGHAMTETFAGHRYGLQALKPAIESVLIFQKPYDGRAIDNITETGAGVLNVEGGRIATDDNLNGGGYVDGESRGMWSSDNGEGGFGRLPGQFQQPQGRWPANFYLDAEAARRLDEQSGESKSTDRVRHNSRSWGDGNIYGIGNPTETNGFNDSGGASRFFFRVDEQIDAADPVRYVAKASRRERDAGLEGMPTVKMGMSNGAQVHGEGYDKGQDIGLNRVIERRNPHPTVKPLALTRYLATLLLPPAEYAPRRLFCPFAGVASECIGAMQAGWEHVEGVELTEEYLPIARARVEYWQKQVEQKELPL